MTALDMTDDLTLRYVSASVLKGHIRLMSVGMKHSRMTATQALAKATELTGNKYSARVKTDYTKAIDDLKAVMDICLKAKEEGGQ